MQFRLVSNKIDSATGAILEKSKHANAVPMIGISGKMGTGKTTLATHLLALYGKEGINVRLTGFGDFVKDEVSMIYNFPRDWTLDDVGKAKLVKVPAECMPEHKPWGRDEATVRELMQYYATDFVRNHLNEYYWLNRMQESLAAWVADGSKKDGDKRFLAIIHDVRFPNELQYVQNHGFSVRLHPYNAWKAGKNAGHASETALDGTRFDAEYQPVFGTLNVVAKHIHDSYPFEKIMSRMYEVRNVNN